MYEFAQPESHPSMVSKLSKDGLIAIYHYMTPSRSFRNDRPGTGPIRCGGILLTLCSAVSSRVHLHLLHFTPITSIFRNTRQTGDDSDGELRSTQVERAQVRWFRRTYTISFPIRGFLPSPAHAAASDSRSWQGVVVSLFLIDVGRWWQENREMMAMVVGTIQQAA